jgi:hypothetical protein
MKRNKIGAAFLVSVLALAGIGVTYAGFSDNINVYGVLDTSTVTLEIEGYSGTWVWKIYDAVEGPIGDPPFNDDTYFSEEEEILIFQGLTINKPSDVDIQNWLAPSQAQYMLVAYSEAKVGGTTYTPDGGEEQISDIDVEFSNLFPCIDFRADFVIHYTGDMPGRLYGPHYIENVWDVVNGEYYTGEGYNGNNWLEDLWLLKHPFGDGSVDETVDYGIWFEAYNITPIFDDTTGDLIDYTLGPQIDIGQQLEYCDYIVLYMYVHLPQDNQFQGCSGKFSIDIGAIQWWDPDECEEPEE